MSEQIENAAQQPKKATFDGQTFEQHSLQDQIAADEYVNSKKALKSKTRGVFLTQIKPPGTT